jgi:undecaprenyl pyrophosphate phosphatase UppP
LTSTLRLLSAFWVPFSPILLALVAVTKRGEVYNLLWALVFGFATLNILGLVARRFDSQRSRLSFGEMIAIMVVVLSVLLLAWELLYLFKVLPIKIEQ